MLMVSIGNRFGIAETTFSTLLLAVVCSLGNAQLQDGSWELYSEKVTFDGESTTGEPGVSHTVALALLSLRIYLDGY